VTKWQFFSQQWTGVGDQICSHLVRGINWINYIYKRRFIVTSQVANTKFVLFWGIQKQCGLLHFLKVFCCYFSKLCLIIWIACRYLSNTALWYSGFSTRPFQFWDYFRILNSITHARSNCWSSCSCLSRGTVFRISMVLHLSTVAIMLLFTGWRVSILGGHSNGHSKQKSV
jgi:hypothetical protein